MSLGYIPTLSLYWKIIIALQIFKRVEEYLGGSLLRTQVSQIIQLLYSMLITVPCILKAMHVALLLYLSLKSLLTTIIYVYYMVYQRTHLLILDIKVNQFKYFIPDPNMANYTFRYIIKSSLLKLLCTLARLS